MPEEEFPLGSEVITGGFSKDLKSFLLWPGRIQTQAMEIDKAASGDGRMLNVCSKMMGVKIRDTGRFLQNIQELHQILILGNYTRAIDDALFGMNMNLRRTNVFYAACGMKESTIHLHAKEKQL